MILLSALAAVSLAYFILLVIYTGMDSLFNLFWLGLSLLLFGCAALLSLARRGVIPRPGMMLRTVILTLVFLGLLIFGIFQVKLSGCMKAQAAPGLDYIIVLGTKVNGSTPTRQLARRLDAAAKYMKENPDTIALVSGGRGSGADVSEAQAMYRYLVVKRGISAARIIREEDSRTTFENIANCYRLLGAQGAQARVGVVSNDFHLFRALTIAAKAGYQPEALAAPSDPLLLPHYMTREFFAFFKGRILGEL